MRSEWRDLRLGDVSENISRRFDFSDKPKVVFINTGDVLEGKFLVNHYSDSDALPGQAKKAIKQDDILFTEIRPANKRFAYVDFNSEDYVVSTKFMVIKANELISPRYLYLVLTSNQVLREFQHVAESRSGTFPQITFDAVSYLPIKVPPLPIQKKIAHIFSTLDDKIELNRKMNETLEAMAQALFKSWFVDFDPVHVKVEAKSEPELEVAASALGISKEILDLFPSEFEESEMGMIPLGWEVSSIGNEFTVTMGQSPSGKSYNETKNGIIFFQGRRDFGTYFPSERVYTTEPKRLAKEDDILLSVRAPVGDINIAMKECCIGRGLSALKHKSNSLGYSYLVLKNLRVYFDGYNTEGTVFGSVNQNTLKSLKLLKDEHIIHKFNMIVEPMFRQIKNNSLEILSLQNTRDTLLPKLLSGELDV